MRALVRNRVKFLSRTSQALMKFLYRVAFRTTVLINAAVATKRKELAF